MSAKVMVGTSPLVIKTTDSDIQNTNSTTRSWVPAFHIALNQRKEESQGLKKTTNKHPSNRGILKA